MAATIGSSSPRRFQITYVARPGWRSALVAIPLAILGFVSVVLVLTALVFVAAAVAIGARWFRPRSTRASEPAAMRRLESQEMAAGVTGPRGSPL
jgi:hypothetical protein